MSTELIAREEVNALAVRPAREVLLSPVMNLQTAVSRLNEFQSFVAGYLQESKDGGQDGGDFGAIPGAGSKKVLLKSGADKLCELYGLYDEYDIRAEENFETNLFFYSVKCTLRSRRDDSVIGTGLGSCSTYESKYRWRDSQRKCPKCEKENIRISKQDGGYYCWAKTGGCGATFKKGDASIEKQVIGRVENPDILDTVNTVLKMAKKRAKVDAVIGATRSSGIFTSDLEDIPIPETKAAPVTTQDIPVSGPAQSGDGKVVATPIEPEPPSKSTPKAGESGTPPADEFIDIGRQKNIHIEFRKAVRKDAKNDADFAFYDFLLNEGYYDTEDGNKKVPTASRIPMAKFEEVKAKAIKKAASL